MVESRATAPATRRTAAILIGACIAILGLGIYITVEWTLIQPRREAAELQRRDQRIQAAQAANVGQDEFWKAPLWDTPTTTRSLTVVGLTFLPATVGAMVAAWITRRHHLSVAMAVIGSYMVVCWLPLINDDDGHPLWWSSATQALSPYAHVVIALGMLVALPAIAAAVMARHQQGTYRLRHA